MSTDLERYDDTAASPLAPVAPTSAAPASLLGDTPREIVANASAMAQVLRDVIKQQGMFASIGGRSHVTIEGWQTVGIMLGLTARTTWTRRIPDEGYGDGWEARAEIVRMSDGSVVGADEAQCLRGEKTWKTREDFTLRSMAQTRAKSKAFRGVLAFVVTMAGYETTPAEEMDYDPSRSASRSTRVIESFSSSEQAGTAARSAPAAWPNTAPFSVTDEPGRSSRGPSAVLTGPATPAALKESLASQFVKLADDPDAAKKLFDTIGTRSQKKLIEVYGEHVRDLETLAALIRGLEARGWHRDDHRWWHDNLTPADTVGVSFDDALSIDTEKRSHDAAEFQVDLDDGSMSQPSGPAVESPPRQPSSLGSELAHANAAEDEAQTSLGVGEPAPSTGYER